MRVNLGSDKMEISDIKKYLFNNPNKIIELLEDCKCHHIRHYDGKRIQSARPEGDNPSSVQVILSDTNLHTVIHTDATFEGGDIFYLIAHLKNINNKESIKWVYGELGFDVSYNPKTEKNLTLSFVNEFVKFNIKYDKYNTIENNILPDITKEQFIDAPHKKFTDEGISLKTQKKFGICYDMISSRIVIPIHDLKGNLVTFKGRSIIDNGIKYIAYYPFNGLDILFGYYQNFFNIIQKGEVIVFEAEKSVFKSDTMGVDNTLAIMRHKLSSQQKDALLRLQVPITFGFDKDISASEIILLLEDLNGLADIYIMYDRSESLNGKNSPVDEGRKTFDELYNNKITLSKLEELVYKGVLK
jgi:DNA primase